MPDTVVLGYRPDVLLQARCSDCIHIWRKRNGSDDSPHERDPYQADPTLPGMPESHYLSPSPAKLFPGHDPLAPSRRSSGRRSILVQRWNSAALDRLRCDWFVRMDDLNARHSSGGRMGQSTRLPANHQASIAFSKVPCPNFEIRFPKIRYRGTFLSTRLGRKKPRSDQLGLEEGG